MDQERGGTAPENSGTIEAQRLYNLGLDLLNKGELEKARAYFVALTQRFPGSSLANAAWKILRQKEFEQFRGQATGDWLQRPGGKADETVSARFQTLFSLGKFISGLGWVVVTVAGILLLLGLSELGGRGGSLSGLMQLVWGGIGVVNGLLIVAGGQTITCFVSIERNTHATYELTRKLVGARADSKEES